MTLRTCFTAFARFAAIAGIAFAAHAAYAAPPIKIGSFLSVTGGASFLGDPE